MQVLNIRLGNNVVLSCSPLTANVDVFVANSRTNAAYDEGSVQSIHSQFRSGLEKPLVKVQTDLLQVQPLTETLNCRSIAAPLPASSLWQPSRLFGR